MPSRINFQVLNVGQGSGNFVEIFADETDTTPITTVLIDLGSEGASSSHHGPSLDRIVTSLNSMTNPEIACLCLSHSDTDHISMILQLLAAFDPPGTVPPTKNILTVKKAYYGGNQSLYSKRKGPNVLTKLADYMPKTVKPVPVTSNTSSYVEPKVALYEDKTLGFNLQLLIGNTTKAEDEEIDDSKKLPKTGAVNINTVSLVVVFDWNGVQFITTGDATGITMLRANGVMGTASGSFFTDPLMLTIPHHGSYATAYDFTGQGLRGIDEKTAQLKLFARRCGAKTLSASAGQVEKFKHPSAAILGIFWTYCDTQVRFTDPGAITSAHFYTAYNANEYGFQLHLPSTGATAWPALGKNWWFTLQSQVPIFTTDYFVRTQLVAYVEPAPPSPPSTEKKVKASDIDYMGVLPSSVATPSPGWIAAMPADSKFPKHEEVGWNYALDSAKKCTITQLVPTSASRAFLHSLISNAEDVYGWPAASEKSASRTPARTTTLARVMPTRLPAPQRPPPPGSPRIKRR